MDSRRPVLAEAAEGTRLRLNGPRRRMRARRRWGPGAACALTLALLLRGPATLAAQRADPTGPSEAQRVRAAAVLESRGDFDGSERILRDVLAGNPASLNALISYQRILNIQGRPEDLLEALDGLLALEPGSSIAHQLRLRTYGAVGDEESLRAATEAWIAATPHLETPYRESARAWRALGRVDLAVQVLELGRSRIQRADALALELGDAYVDAGTIESAVREWDRAVGENGSGLLLVQRRLANLPNGGAALIPGLVASLTRAPTTVERRRGAVQLAIAAGLEAQAGAIAEGLAADLTGAARTSFMVDVARGADGNGLHRLAYWAYRQLWSDGEESERMRAVQARAAELALVIGDTVGAARSYAAIEQSAEPGSAEQRHAAAMRIRLAASEGDAHGAAAGLEEYRRTFPDAPELDETAATVASALLAVGDSERAARALVGVNGPRAGLVRARLLIHDGDVDGGRRELLRAAPGLHGAQATDAIALATLLGRLSAEAGQVVALAMASFSDDDAAGAVDMLLAKDLSVPDVDRPAVLDLGARLADRASLHERALDARTRLVQNYPDSRQVPAALLALAQSMARRGAPAEEVAPLLERLIFEHPRSALVPQARREMDRLRGQTQPDGTGAGGREGGRTASEPATDDRKVA